MSILKEEEKDKIQNVLDEILEQTVSVDGFQEMAAKSLEDAEYEKVNRMLLDYYDKANRTNFQENLKAQLKAMTSEKVLSKLENTKDLEETKEKEKQEVSNELGVEGDTLEEASKKVEQAQKEKEKKGAKQTEELDLRAELMKQVYIEEFKKYANTLYRLKESQIGANELTVGDKEGTELVLHENYLKNLERNYSGYAKQKGLAEKTLDEQEEIQNIKKDLKEKIGRGESESREQIQKKIRKIQVLSQKKLEIANQINELSESSLAKDQPEKFKEMMDEYQKEYRDITYQIREESPTIEEYIKQMDEERENRELADQYGMTEENSDFVAGNVVEKNGIGREPEDKKGTPEKEVKNTIVKEDETLAKNIDDYLREIEIQIGQGRFEKAEELLQSTESMLDIKDNEEQEANEKKAKDSNAKLESKNQKTEKQNEDLTDERGYWKNASFNSVEISEGDNLNERLKRASEKFKEKFPQYGKVKEVKMKEIAKQKQLG